MFNISLLKMLTLNEVNANPNQARIDEINAHLDWLEGLGQASKAKMTELVERAESIEKDYETFENLAETALTPAARKAAQNALKTLTHEYEKVVELFTIEESVFVEMEREFNALMNELETL